MLKTEEIVSINMSCDIFLWTKYLKIWTNKGKADKFTSTFVSLVGMTMIYIVWQFSNTNCHKRKMPLFDFDNFPLWQFLYTYAIYMHTIVNLAKR